MECSRVQIVHGTAIDSSMPGDFAVPVSRTFPHANGGKVRRLVLRDEPLVHRIVGNSVHSDFAVAPDLSGGPLNAVVDILRLPRRPGIEKARRTAGSARIDAQTGIAVRYPLLRVDQLPDLIFVARTF